ncbi:MAG: hypothetical protein DRO67_00105 [Candidatus Asgardarchaeum californiense]|nr:MAG: hypothetical protein DRO67_00105 [Candidatus Asgardarchaeum californiense]
MQTITAKKMTLIIRANFLPEDKIMLYSENARTHEYGWAFDTAYEIIKVLLDPEVFDDEAELYYFSVGKCIMYEGTML